ncbi:MAG TPA: sulfate ABC transporter substrate-binding protein [Thermoleophilaceae bacterium]|jgi:sulfate transport system substrate-binding protein
MNLVQNPRRLSAVALSVAALAIAGLVVGCGGSGGSSNKLSLVAYSTPQEAYAALIPAFQKTPAGKGVTFSQSYGASGDQSRAVASGLPADVVEFSLAPDVDKLVKAGLVDSNWAQNKYKGFVTDSVVTLVVRKGNPKNIHDWSDLIKPGVQVIEPNPFSSGSARWNVMAAYGAQLKEGKSPAQAQQYLQQLFKNVVVQDKSARDALQTFTSGKGDVMIAYENEAITAQKKGKAVDYVTPKDTILIQNPIAVTKDAKPAAEKFVNWLHTDAAQKIFAAQGYRPVISSLVNKQKFPTPPGLFTIDDVGGWNEVTTKFFDPDNGIVAKIEQGLGVSTAKN